MNLRWIQCHNKWDKMWGLLLYFENEPTAKARLEQAYVSMMNAEEARRSAYQNTSKFIYFLKQGKAYFQAAQNSEQMVRPLLLYYGMTGFMKALLLLKDPQYPQTTAVLQHGLTTRKKKKSQYRFPEDEVKIQKDGLVPYFAKIYLNQPLVIHAKYKISHLLTFWPELQDVYALLPDRPASSSPPSTVQLDELLVFNMIMYVLGMLCRYDTEAWGDILFSFSSSDLSVIAEFLQLTFHKFPHLILNHLYTEKLIFISAP